MPDLRAGTLQWAVISTAAYSVFAISWFFLIKRYPQRWLFRRYLMIVSDLGIVSGSMFLAGDAGAYPYPVYLWIIVGTGLRYGPRHLIFGLFCGLVGFGAVLKAAPFWQEHQQIGISLLFGIAILPLFYLTVLRRIQSLNSRLTVELERSKVAETAKGDFLANMSHEIRTPLNGILGMAEIMKDDGLNSFQRNNLEIITRSGESLLNIINDILDFSKISSEKMQIESVPFNLEQIILDVYLLLKPTADEKGIHLINNIAPELPRTYLGDPTRVRQILFNLVGNAIKFTEQGQVEIKVEGKETSGVGPLMISVEDTSVGIPADRLDAIFQKFEQANTTTTRNYGGTGLGLAISLELVSLMGGQIEATSELGVGSNFKVELPLAKSDIDVSQPRLANTQAKFDLHALVAEDNPINQKIFSKQLKRIGISSVVVDNGQKALDALDNSFDIVFLDVRMPVMTGLEAVAEIRRLEDGKTRIPVVALTADATAEDTTRSLDAGMDAHLSKPLYTEDLVHLLSGTMGFTAIESEDSAPLVHA